MRWITRQNIKVDRVACPWLIRRFVRAIAQGLASLGLPDEERLRVGFQMYDALYAYVREHVD